jgi:hypothetical protein
MKKVLPILAIFLCFLPKPSGGFSFPISSLKDLFEKSPINERLRVEYLSTKREINMKRAEYNNQYGKVIGDEDKDKIIRESKSFIFKRLSENIFPAWYGTKWGFYGNSRIPGQGEIACGAFVVFTLQDAGFSIPSKMANQPSENIIKNLINPSDVKRFCNATPMEKVLDWVKSKGEGLFIVGLDIHVGFLIYKDGKVTFCHSNYYYFSCKVVNQEVTAKSPLTDSKYRVIGKILDDQMMRKWILNEGFPITYDYYKK